MRWRIPLFVGLIAFAAVSCDQQPVEPKADQATAAPTFNFGEGPSDPGNSPLHRQHFDDWCHWCETTDPELDLFAFHYDDPWEVYCNDGSTFTEWDLQENWNNGLNLNALARDEALYIYDTSDLFDAWYAGYPEPFCTFMEESWLYSGTHDMNATESWTEGFARGVYMMTATGLVYDHDGALYNYREKQKYMWPADMWTHESIVVH